MGVRLSRDPQRQVIIPIRAEPEYHDGASSADYTAPTSVTFNSGETSKTIIFTATHDTVNDDNETVLLHFGPDFPSGVIDSIFSGVTTVTIKDDDRPTSFTVSFERGASSPGKSTVAEGGSTTVWVSLSEDPGRETVIPISADHLGGATEDDYSGVPSSVTFGADECRYYTDEVLRDHQKDHVQGGCTPTTTTMRPCGSGSAPRCRPRLTLGRLPTWTMSITEGGDFVVGSAQVGVRVSDLLL